VGQLLRVLPTRQGSFRLFRFAGIDVFVHWSWFIVAVLGINLRREAYTSLLWNALEYLSLFAIVLLHEFGHSLACRQVGGRADQIILWPLGGVAYVAPPPRPGATLWSIAAGPLVNVVLFPVLTILAFLVEFAGWSSTMPNACQFVQTAWYINGLLLAFNLLPVYPLDGGQILRCLLWFAVGPARSLMAVAVVGFVGVAGLFAVGLLVNHVWLLIVSVFILLHCWSGLMHARTLSRMAAAPRRTGFVCPECRATPPVGDFWYCGKCRKPFDTFATQAVCPHCVVQFGVTRCLECGVLRPITEWVSPPPIPTRS
jgi:Zn-dependent protease